MPELFDGFYFVLFQILIKRMLLFFRDNAPNLFNSVFKLVGKMLFDYLFLLFVCLKYFYAVRSKIDNRLSDVFGRVVIDNGFHRFNQRFFAVDNRRKITFRNRKQIADVSDFSRADRHQSHQLCVKTANGFAITQLIPYLF